MVYKGSQSYQKQEFGSGVLNGEIEENVGNHLLLSGPLVDSYLYEIGKGFLEKLRRSHLTGLVLTQVAIFIHRQIFDYLCSIIVAYNGEIRVTKRNKLICFLDNAEGANKLFHPSRFDGSNSLVKRKFKKVVDTETK